MAYLKPDEFALARQLLERLLASAEVTVAIQRHIPTAFADARKLSARLTEIEAAFATPDEIEEARNEYGNDECEIDDGAVSTSRSDDGLWVNAWVWLARSEECRTCAEAIETRALPCDECGHVDEDEDPDAEMAVINLYREESCTREEATTDLALLGMTQAEIERVLDKAEQEREG